MSDQVSRGLHPALTHVCHNHAQLILSPLLKHSHTRVTGGTSAGDTHTHCTFTTPLIPAPSSPSTLLFSVSTDSCALSIPSSPSTRCRWSGTQDEPECCACACCCLQKSLSPSPSTWQLRDRASGSLHTERCWVCGDRGTDTHVTPTSRYTHCWLELATGLAPGMHTLLPAHTGHQHLPKLHPLPFSHCMDTMYSQKVWQSLIFSGLTKNT